LKIKLHDGRILRFWSSATDGPIVLVFHGCPDTRRIAMTGDVAAREVGVRLLAFNRPGYGSSTPMPSTHTSVARDAAELLDIWRIPEVAVLGMSVGAPYAAAFAARYPECTTGLALVGAPAMSTTEAVGTVEEEMARYEREFMTWRAKIDPEDEDDEALAARFLAELPAPDADLLLASAEVVAPTLDYTSAREFVGAMAWEALVKPEGYLRDAALLSRPWDFDVADVACPVSIWAGEKDERAVAASTWWAERLPQATVAVAPDTTHLTTLLTQWPEILRRLSSARG
jgi:pimeloyl-ACP methyl ester carboxylesterase